VVIDKEGNNSDRPEAAVVDEETGKAMVDVLLTSWGVSGDRVGASGMVSNSLDMSGSCSYVFSGPDGASVGRVVGVLESPSSVVCESVNIGVGEFTGGKWTVKLSYSSDYSVGESESHEFEIE
jgi:hypothetical protein